MHWNKKNYKFFYYPSQNFALWQKIAVTQNFYPNFFYSLDPPLSEFKVKFRGHPFAYTLTNTATGLLLKILYLLWNSMELIHMLLCDACGDNMRGAVHAPHTSYTLLLKDTNWTQRLLKFNRGKIIRGYLTELGLHWTELTPRSI